MIYQLIKRDPAWKAAPLCALVSAAVSVCPKPLPAFGPLVILMGLFVSIPHLRATPFEAALPIRPRDLVLARVLSLLWLIWAAATAGAGGLLLANGLTAHTGRAFASGALWTLFAGLAQSVWPKRLAGPHWILYLLFIGMPLAGPGVVDRAGALLPTLCAMVGIALLVRVWLLAPRSFQLAPPQAEADGVAPAGVILPGPAAPATSSVRTLVWAPVLRSVFSWQYVFFVGFIGFQTASGQWPLMTFWVVLTWAASRARTRWLWALPVGRRALLWTLMGPIIAATVVGYILSFRSKAAPPDEPRVMIAIIAAMLAMVLLSVLVTALFDWRGLRKRVRNLIFGPVLYLWFAALMYVLAFTPYNPRTLVRDALVTFSRTQPLSAPALAAAAAALLIALYAAVEKVFREPDFADKPKPQSRDVFA